MFLATRIRDADRTRERILLAAQEVFSTCSYAEARLRDITAEAGVNPALVSRYFGSKLRLYEVALADCLHVETLTGAGREKFGATLVDGFLNRNPEYRNPWPMLIHGASDPDGREVALRLLNERIVTPLAHWFGGDGGHNRAAELVALTSGFFSYRLMLPLEPFQGDLAPSVRRWLVDALQALVEPVETKAGDHL